MLYQFLASIRQEDGTPLMDSKGNITAHLSGLFYRTARLMENGIKPVFVFDGPSPRFKKATKEQRERIKKEAEEKWKKALEEERHEDARKFAQRTSRLTGPMITESKKLLDALGLPVVQAPSEGEAQSAMMVREGTVYAAASQDYDALLFGSPILIRNLSITGKRKIPRQDRYIIVEPEEIRLEETLNALNLTQEQLIMMGLLVGTDYNEGVRGVGPKTALKIMTEIGIKDLDSLKEYIKTKYNAEFPEDINEMYEFFLKPTSESVPKPLFGMPNPEAIRKMLVDEHDFAADRIDGMLTNIEKAVKEKGAQKKLDDWFG